MQNNALSFLFRLFVMTVLLSTAACGWQLRGFNQGKLPAQLALKIDDPYAPLARQLQQTLVRRGVTVNPSAAVQLWLDKEVLSKRTVAVTSIGASAQYELQLKVAFSFSRQSDTQNAQLTPNTLITQRVFDFAPGSNLAKTEEEQTLLKEMRQELINRILAQSPTQAIESSAYADPLPVIEEHTLGTPAATSEAQ
ncbi:LPS assembly lipoprotein LptE [Marinagarivorans algicola]|uniref:LPS-assembly lipoprotein LptE n=1 Tax=Marinagarivorans algicola TaxID=1513270 RepID=UPI0006B5BCBA|nr:LPS assembly lipoprotein LptE [Marinagarivorans algicola]